jgi:hypothetical protein
MSDVICTFTIANSGIGGKLTGGFPNGGNIVKPNDNLIVAVQYPIGGTPPANLAGVFVFTAAPNASSSQDWPSPFVQANNSNYICLQQQLGTRSGNDANYVTFTFPAMAYPGGKRGSYELTFIAMDGQRQWSEDPEFDTSS